MAVTLKLSRSNLQTNKYTYTWKRTDGDGAYIGPLDRDRVSKVEGYEVLEFVEQFMAKHGLTSKADFHKVEDALHHPSLSKEIMRKALITGVEKLLGY
jgi:hypothetical protein